MRKVLRRHERRNRRRQRDRRAGKERPLHRDRLRPARRFLLVIDPRHPWAKIEVRLCRHSGRMLEEIRYHEGDKAAKGQRHDRGYVQGLVRSWHRTYRLRSGDQQPICHRGGVVARMFLSLRDVRDSPAEIPSHECVHAAMAWVRMRRTDLSKMDGEEVLAHAQGRLTQQLCNLLHRQGYFA